ncbi:hypothetical protein ACFQ3W_23325 [Paenibacillus puldeungensis]|uniref:Uncharacterized protein n=1 Tax=Paenibacillus puldeungensis TaxID=696536 RepID=A0ABW3S3Q1_9BACL
MIKAIVSLVDGLPLADENAQLEITFDDYFLMITEHKMQGFKKVVVNMFKIPLENIVDTVITTQREIVDKQKSVIGRGIVGGVIFGGAGLILGGMSGIGSKKKTQISDVYIVSYVSSAGEVKNIIFSMPPMMVSVTKKFDKEFKSRIVTIPKSEAVRRVLSASKETVL